MDWLLQQGLTNAVLATLLAVSVALIVRRVRRPEIVHALWVLVLLKFVTPAFLTLPLPSLGQTPSPNAVAPAHRASPMTLEETSRARQADADAIPPATVAEIAFEDDRPIAVTEPGPLAENVLITEEPSVTERSPEPNTLAAWASSIDIQSAWKPTVAAIWIVGVCGWWLLFAIRFMRLRRLLRAAGPAPDDVQNHVRALAMEYGLSRCPRVYFVPCRLSPSLWALGRTPVLLIPKDLWDALTDAERDTLLAHELIHLRRGDHWVRRLEILVLSIYWWHPVTWWARQRLEEAEEQCCDARVVQSQPAEAYAQTLLRTVAFLSRSQIALPAGVSGLGQVPALKRRLAMILADRRPKLPSRAVLAAVLGLGVVLLALLPTWAQAPPRADPPPVEKAPPGSSSPVPEPPALPSLPGRVAPAAYPSPPAVPMIGQHAGEELELLAIQVEGKRAELAEAEALLNSAQRSSNRLANLRKAGAVDEGEVDRARTEVDVLQARLRVKKAAVQEVELRLKHAERRSKPPGGVYGVPATTKPAPSSEAPMSRSAPSAVQGSAANWTPRNPGSGTTMSGAGSAPPAMGMASGPAIGTDKRLKDLETKLDTLLKEIESLRREVRQRPGVPTPPPARPATGLPAAGYPAGPVSDAPVRP